jgi:PIN domain nuclease of toxin-antitoxin system
MEIIIDTHIFLWSLAEPEKLSTKQTKILESTGNIVYLSSVSIAEIMIKASLGKLKVDFDPLSLAIESGFEMLNFTGSDAVLLKDMPFHHKDPFDRMLIAQGMANDYPIMTCDIKFKDYECKVV